MKATGNDNARNGRDHPTILSKPQSPLFTVQPDQLPYPYQKRKVNFNTYSGVKSAIPNSVNGYRAQSSQNITLGNKIERTFNHQGGSISDSFPVQNTKRFTPAVSSTVHNLSYQHSGNGDETHNEDQFQRKPVFSSHSAQFPSNGVDDGSDAVAWLMAVSKKEAFAQQSQQNSVMNMSPGDFRQPTQELHGVSPEFLDVDGSDLFGAKSRSPGSRESLSADVRQEFAEQQYQPPGSPKPNHLRGVTLLSFQGNSTVSPYLDHLTTTNPAMGNAVLAITRLNHGSNPVYLPAAAKAPKGFAIINDDQGRPITAHNLKNVKPQPRNIKSASESRSSVPGSGDQAGYGHTPTALERVTAFKSRIPDSASTIEARALRVQHNTWGNTPANSKAAKSVQSAHSFNVMASGRSTLHDESRLNSPSIDLLVSAQRFPNSPVQMTSPTFRFDETDGPDQFASTVDLGSTASRLHLGASMDRPRTSSPSDVLQGIHKDPLYKVLREECEILRRRPLGVSLTAPLADLASSSPIADGISSAEIKTLKCFTSLPPAVWITTRIVFFLVVAYQECFFGDEGRAVLRASLGVDKIFDVLERQQKTDNISLETIERLYSWPYFQAILSSPRLFAKVLRLIEGGGLPADHSVTGQLQRPVNFFDCYPVEKLQHLRELIRHGQGLFQESALITIVPVCAKLCSWAKKVIAAIYSACLERIRLDEQLKTMSTAPSMMDFADNSLEDSSQMPTQTENRNKKTQSIASTESAKQMSSSLQSGNRIVAAILPHKLINAAYSTHNTANTYSVTLSLAQSATAVDLVLMTPTAATEASFTGELKTTFDLAEMRAHYENQLRERSASPLHRVTTLSENNRPSAIAGEGSVVSFLQLEQGKKSDESSTVVDARPQEVRVHLHSSNCDIMVHPVVSHCLSPDVAAELLVVDRDFCRDVGLLRPEEISGGSFSVENDKARRKEARLLIESGQLVSFFSLVLVPPATSKTAEFASTPAGEVWSLDEAPPGPSQAMDGGFAQSSNYVVCVTETPSSWAAFQLARRLAKPSDTVSVVHVPWLDMVDPRRDASDMGCSKQRYEQQRALAVARIARLTAQYRAVDHNLFVDALPDYFEVAERAAGYYFQRKSIDRKLRKTPPFTLNSSNVADNYLHNQEKFFLASRLLSAAQQFEPTFLLLGSDSVDIALGMSTAHERPLSTAFPCSSKKTWSGSQSSQSKTPTSLGSSSKHQGGVSHPATESRVNAHEPQKSEIDDADSVGFIYNDSTVLSNTYDSFDPPAAAARKGSNRASFMSALDNDSNAAVEEERGLYEGGEDEGEEDYENDSFVRVDRGGGEDDEYGADSFDAADEQRKPQVALQSLNNTGELSYSASVIPDLSSPFAKFKPNSSVSGLSIGELQRSFAEIQAASAADHVDVGPSEEETAELHRLQRDYLLFKARSVQLVEMVLHTVESGKRNSDNFSIILTNSQQKHQMMPKRNGK